MSRLIKPDENWITMADARRILGLKVMPRDVRLFVRTRSRSLWSRRAHGSGLLWNRREIEELKRVSEQSGLSYSPAARVLAARREGTI